MENFDRENTDELLKIHQICQYFPHQNFVMQYAVTLLFDHHRCVVGGRPWVGLIEDNNTCSLHY